MHHPHIVQTRAVIETADWIFVVMELMEGCELQKNIETRGTYSEGDAAEVMLRLSLTLGFLHSQGAFIHACIPVAKSYLLVTAAIDWGQELRTVM
jgi:serine/threonine protein kinase